MMLLRDEATFQTCEAFRKLAKLTLVGEPCGDEPYGDRKGAQSGKYDR